MRILITADLHYNVTRSKPGVETLAAQVNASSADALVLLGDTAGADPEPMRECLHLFDDFAGRKFLVPGNHCLWCRAGEDSLQRYRELLPEIAAGAGFVMLDHNPTILGNVGFVGSVGWYDYSFADEDLDIPKAFYSAKISPGAARRYTEHEHLLKKYDDRLTERQHNVAVRWMDGVHIRLPFDDATFAQQLSDTLAQQIATISPKVDRVVAFLHHLPFQQMVPPDRPDRFAFASAYMGTRRLGDRLQECPKVTHVYCGHSHWPHCCKIGHLNVVNVGSTYVDKRLEVLNLAEPTQADRLEPPQRTNENTL